MTRAQTEALENVQSILQMNFHQSLVSVVYVDEADGCKKKIHTLDGTATDAQAEHLARTTLSNIEILTRGMIITIFDKPLPVANKEPRFSKTYEEPSK